MSCLLWMGMLMEALPVSLSSITIPSMSFAVFSGDYRASTRLLKKDRLHINQLKMHVNLTTLFQRIAKFTENTQVMLARQYEIREIIHFRAPENIQYMGCV